MKGRLRTIPIASTVIIFSLIFLFPMAAFPAGPPEKGATLPSFQLPAPTLETDMSYLGLKGATFRLQDISCQVLVIEIIGVYCARCYQQAPLFNKLFTRLNRKGTGDKVKMVAIAAGGTANETEHLRKTGSYEFPVVSDETYAVHKLMGEPRTPFTLVIDREGKVLFSHLGVIEDVDTFYQQIMELVK
jgi:peroxiredoxin